VFERSASSEWPSHPAIPAAPAAPIRVDLWAQMRLMALLQLQVAEGRVSPESLKPSRRSYWEGRGTWAVMSIPQLWEGCTQSGTGTEHL
jgi:hypothetical protein